MRSGLQEGLPYSLSRWTDISGKWAWLESCLDAGRMIAMDPVTTVPSVWSLKPEDTLGLVFWTKDPGILVARQLRLAPYKVTVNVTATGWAEVESGAPGLDHAGKLLIETVNAFGRARVRWRFSPIPLLPNDVVRERFGRLLQYAARAKLSEVYVSFLQPNALVPEGRSAEQRFELLNELAMQAGEHGIKVALCKDDRSFDDWPGAHFTLAPCVAPDDVTLAPSALESCGCVRVVDPFTVNESCRFGCAYCYVADRKLSARKRNTVGRQPSSLRVLH